MQNSDSNSLLNVLKIGSSSHTSSFHEIVGYAIEQLSSSSLCNNPEDTSSDGIKVDETETWQLLLTYQTTLPGVVLVVYPYLDRYFFFFTFAGNTVISIKYIFDLRLKGSVSHHHYVLSENAWKVFEWGFGHVHRQPHVSVNNGGGGFVYSWKWDGYKHHVDIRGQAGTGDATHAEDVDSFEIKNEAVSLSVAAVPVSMDKAYDWGKIFDMVVWHSLDDYTSPNRFSQLTDLEDPDMDGRFDGAPFKFQD